MIAGTIGMVIRYGTLYFTEACGKESGYLVSSPSMAFFLSLIVAPLP